MMRNDRRHRVAAERFSERRRQEDEAPRLAQEVLGLVSLRLQLSEDLGAAGSPPVYTRHYVVARAPARFFVPCGDARCLEGGHDLTAAVMRGLRARQTSFSGAESCTGSVGSSPCSRTLRFEAAAEYQREAASPSASAPAVPSRARL